MDFIKHQDSGAAGLRIAATVFVIIGWIALAVGILGAFINIDIFFAPLLCGIGGLAVSYLIACFIRGFASLVEAAELYWYKNAPESEE